MEQKKPNNPECNIQYSSAIILALNPNTKIHNIFYGYLMEIQRSEIEISFFLISNNKNKRKQDSNQYEWQYVWSKCTIWRADDTVLYNLSTWTTNTYSKRSQGDLKHLLLPMADGFVRFFFARLNNNNRNNDWTNIGMQFIHWKTGFSAVWF